MAEGVSSNPEIESYRLVIGGGTKGLCELLYRPAFGLVVATGFVYLQVFRCYVAKR
jgi:hypothetical protein